jgi:hypothetical protein
VGPPGQCLGHRAPRYGLGGTGAEAGRLSELETALAAELGVLSPEGRTRGPIAVDATVRASRDALWGEDILPILRDEPDAPTFCG